MFAQLACCWLASWSSLNYLGDMASGSLLVCPAQWRTAVAAVCSGVVISNTFVPVLLLTSLAKRVTISKFPQFISDDILTREMFETQADSLPDQKTFVGL